MSPHNKHYIYLIFFPVVSFFVMVGCYLGLRLHGNSKNYDIILYLPFILPLVSRFLTYNHRCPKCNQRIDHSTHFFEFSFTIDWKIPKKCWSCGYNLTKEYYVIKN